MNQPTTTYYSNGKLLLSGEYLVLDGALALGVPTKFGQDLTVQPIEEKRIYWRSLDENGTVWLDTVFDLPFLSDASVYPIIASLQNILTKTLELNPNLLQNSGFNVTTNLSFPRDWGLGSSSTLINNIAQWAKVDAFDLLNKTLGGSGYDIACAQNDNPILFQLKQGKPNMDTVDFYPAFGEQLYFVYLNKKQKSNEAIARYREINKDKNRAIKTISEITKLLIDTSKLDEFELLISEHEKVVSSILQLPTVQDAFFKDYFGKTKSLGAWGGDFILATGNDDTPKYFSKKGFETVLLYEDMVLKNKKDE